MLKQNENDIFPIDQGLLQTGFGFVNFSFGVFFVFVFFYLKCSFACIRLIKLFGTIYICNREIPLSLYIRLEFSQNRLIVPRHS